MILISTMPCLLNLLFLLKMERGILFPAPPRLLILFFASGFSCINFVQMVRWIATRLGGLLAILISSRVLNDETFSSVVKPTTVCTVLTLGLSKGWPVH